MMSPKKFLVVALTCLPAVALGQAEAAKPAEPKPLAASVYGTLNVNLQTTRQQGVAARDAISTDSSNIGFRGTADFGGGLGATVQCETAADISGRDTRALCNRNSRAGVTTAVGTIWYGNWDTPFKAAAYGTKADDPFGNTDVFAYQGIMGSPGFNYRSGAFVTATGAAPSTAASASAPFPAGSTVGGFDLRAQDSVGFHSAKIQGLSVKAQWSVDEFKDAKGIIVPQLFGGVVNFDQGPISLYASIEDHEDAGGLATISVPAYGPVATPVKAAVPAFGATVGNSAGVSSRDWAWRIGAGYELGSPFGTTTVSAAYEQIKFSQNQVVTTGQLKDYKRPAWQVAAKHRLGNNEVRARFSMAGNGDCTGIGFTCKTDGYGANMLALGYAYYLAKSTQVYLHFAQINNKANAQYTFSIGGAPAIAGATTKGADPRALALGVRVAF